MSEVSLILDIGNGSIGAAVVSYEKKKPSKNPAISNTRPEPTVLYSHREPLTFLPEVNEERLLAGMLELLKSVLTHVRTEAIALIPKNILGSMHFTHVVSVFSSPWYVSQTSIVKKESETPFHINNALVNEMVNKEEVRFAEALANGSYEKYFGNKVMLLEQALVHTAINGYEVANPAGKWGRLFETTLFTSLISEKVLRLVEDVFYRIFHIRQIQCFSYALVSWNAVRTLFPDVNNFVFLDVSGETTDLTITVRGAITEIVSFPFGRATILRLLVDSMKTSAETALSLIRMRSDGTLEKGTLAEVEKALQVASDQWTSAFNQTLSAVSKKYNLPKRAFVTVDTTLASFLSGVLNRADIGPALFKGPFDVTIVADDTIAPFIQTEWHDKTLPGAIDPALALEAIFFGNKIS